MHTTGSWHTCPCAECRTKLRTYRREHTRDRRANPGPRLTDAARMVAHLDALRATGMSYRAIADLSGYGKDTLWEAATGRTKRVRVVMAEDILSIRVPEVAA